MHGRAVPVEAKLRKGKGAVGRYGAESKDAKGKSDSDEDAENSSARQHVSQWKKKQKDIKYNSVRTTEELLNLAANNQKKLKKVEEMLGHKQGL